MATPAGTRAYRDRFAPDFARAYFRRFDGCPVSSIGIGTYLGEPTGTVDDRYHDALTTAFERGINVVDTAANYRCGRSERVVGDALKDAAVDRDAILVATKGGFLPFDGDRPDDPAAYIRETFLDTGRIDAEDLARGSHCIAPDYLADRVERSRQAMGLDMLDLFYVHNPETQLHTRSREDVYDQLEDAFVALERRVDAGKIRTYGVATWHAFRVPADDPRYLSLPEVVRRARAAADRVDTDTTHLRAIQLPFAASMADAFTRRVHEGPDGPQSALQFAHDAGLSVFASAPLAQGDLLSGLPPAVEAEVAGETPAARAINFARSAPGITAALVGMSRSEHVRENVAAGSVAPLGARAFDAVFA